MTGWAVALLCVAILVTVSWAIVLGARFGHLIAVPATFAAGGILLLGALVVSRIVRVEPFIGVAVVTVVAGVTAVVLWRRAGFPRPSRRSLLVWLPPLAGAVVWVGVVLAARLVPGASVLSWAMNGDTFNNLYYAHAILDGGGLALGGFENPVPFPAVLIATIIGPGRAALCSDVLLQHDLTGFSLAWAILLGLSGLAIGATLASAVPRHRPKLTIAVGVLGSLTATTWFVGGLPVQWGYFNVHVAIPVVLAAWLLFLASRRRPLPALMALLAVLTLAMATWTPLAAFPAAFIVLIAWRQRAVVRSLHGRRAIAMLLAVATPVFWVVLVVLPTYLQQSTALEAPGHGYPSTWWMLAALAIALVLVVVLGRRHTDRTVDLGLLAILLCSAVVVLALVAIAAGDPEPWAGYYPTKLCWLLVIILGTIVLSRVLHRVSRQRPSRRTAIVTVALTAAASLIAAVLPLGGPADVVVRQPAVRILSGSIWHTGDRAADQIIALSRPGRLGILWKSGDPDEAMIDFWVLVSNGGDLAGDPYLRDIAFTAYRAYRATGTWHNDQIADLCTIVTGLKEPVMVRTRDAALPDALASACPATDDRVSVIETRE